MPGGQAVLFPTPDCINILKEKFYFIFVFVIVTVINVPVINVTVIIYVIIKMRANSAVMIYIMTIR
jgi:hypothetical protein